ncbi:MAG: hypothetical protein ABH872_05825 [Candidatus Omnitrophota bacterium]
MKYLVLFIISGLFNFVALADYFEIIEHRIDLDNDGKEEIIEHSVWFDAPGTMLPVPSIGEVVVYDNHGVRQSNFFMPGSVDRIEFVVLANDGCKQIAAFSYDKNHHANIAIYGYKDNQLYPVFSSGSDCGIETCFDSDKPFIRVGAENLANEGSSCADEPLWQVYVWDGYEFVYNKEMSSAPKYFQPAQTDEYVGNFKIMVEK